MTRSRCSLVCLVVFFLAGVAGVAGVAAADTVWLKNGDRITGTVKEIGAGTIIVTTNYAGDVTIAMDQVKGIDTEKPLALERSDGAIEEGALSYTDETQHVTMDGEGMDMAVDSLNRAAPTREALDKVIRKANRIWSGSVDSGAVFRSGETDRYDATLDVVLTRKRPVHTLTLKMKSSYGETDDVLNTQRIYGEAKWQYFFGGRPMFAFGVTTAEHDKLRRLESRYTTGAGIGYTLIDVPHRKLSGELGLEYAWERWDNFAIGGVRDAVFVARTNSFNRLRGLLGSLNSGLTAPDLNALLQGVRILRGFAGPDLGDPTRVEEYPSGRIGLSYLEKLFGTGTLTDDLLLLPSLGDIGEFRLTNTLAYTMPIMDSLSFRASLRTEYQSDPGADNIEKLDNTLSLGLRYSF